MKISTFVSNNIVLKFMSGAIIFLAWEVNFNHNAVASTLKIQENNSYDLEKLSYFSLKLNRDIYNQLEKELLKQESDFSEYINLLNNRLEINQDRFQAKPNILIQSEEDKEEKLIDSFLDSLKELEFRAISADYSNQASIPVLPQVNYRNIYKDIYDFDVTLADYSQQRSFIRRAPKNTNITQQGERNKYFSSYFQENKKPDYPSFKNQPQNINYPKSSLLASPQNQPTLASLTSSPLIDSSLPNNNTRKFPFAQNDIEYTNQQDYNQNYVNDDDSNSGLENQVQAVYIPSTNIEIYQFNNFDLPSALNGYQKPEHQEELDEKLQKQQEKLKKQRQEISKRLSKLRQKRRKARERELKKYEQKRRQALIKAMNQQKKLQEQRQQQFNY